VPDFGAQIQIDGVWTDVSVLTSDPARVTGGRAKNAVVADPARCGLTLRNDDGYLSSRNPRSPYLGFLGRSTPARAWVPDDTHLWISVSGDIASTPDTAALDTIGDMDVRIDVEPLTWETDSILSLCGKYLTTGDQRSWALWMRAYAPTFRWSPDGTLSSAITVEATDNITPAGSGRCAIRVTLDVNNGAGGWTVTFYTSDTINGTWTQLGDPVTGAGVTSVYASTAEMRIGFVSITAADGTGRYHAMQVRDGIGGTVVANPDFTAQTAGATSFADSAGRTWTLSAGAELRDFDIRMSGEVADWPVRWVTSGRKKTAKIEIGGWLRRLQQPSEPLRSPLYREATSAANLPLMVGYWPCEDGSDARSIASALAGGTAMTITGEPDLASSERIPGSAPLLGFQYGVALTGLPIAHTGTGVIAMRMVVDAPATGWLTDAVLAEVWAVGGSATRWLLEVGGAGQLRVRGMNAAGAEIANTLYINFDILGRRQMIGWQLTQTGADIYWQIFTRRISDDLAVSEVGLDGTFTTRTVGRSSQIRISPLGELDGGAIGHIMLGTSASLAATIDTAIVGNDGETAGRRLLRLGEELGIPVRIIGDPDNTDRMGPQQPGKALELFTSCAAVDRGLLGEARDAMMLEYRTRMSLYNQVPRAVLQYGAEGESPHLEPDEPTEDVVNDYTAERRSGSSYQATVTTGLLSIQEHPAGVGRRPDGATLDFETDDQLHDAAWWEVHLGTWDEYRHPVVRIKLSKLVDAGKPELARAIAAAKPGDRIVITGPPDWLPPEPIDLQVQGWAEDLPPRSRSMQFNTVPHGPWVVGVAGVDLADSDGTTLVSGLSVVTPGTSQAVSVVVVGTPWSLSSVVPMVMWILHPSGAKAERVTVTAVSGATSPQTFTVERGLDGYTLAHDAGASLVLYQPLRWAR
jgi:hypothetical protein